MNEATISRLHGKSRQSRRKIGMADMGISRGQLEYTMLAMLGQQNANITVGQLLAKCPSLQRELCSSISTRKKKEVAMVDAFESKCNLGDMHSPQVEATINGNLVKGCMLDGGVAVNVMARWLMDDLGMSPNKNSSICLKAIDQQIVRPLGQIANVPVMVNGVTVSLDFQVLNIDEANSGYQLF